jgi:hypothetical protein
VTARTRRRSAQGAAVVAALILLVWILLRPHPIDEPVKETASPPAAQTIAAGSVLKPKPCYSPATAPFTPTKITVPGVTQDATVLALPRDGNNVPQAPPISGAGKTQFAWSVRPDPMPGDPQGNVLLNAHTWPDGTALGNKLLDGLHVGGRIVVHGVTEKGQRQTLCYEVTKRDVIVAANGSYEYYESNGPPQIALIVCSPPRLGPGDWKNRTIWYASPLSG